jgi:hypothetical protein
MLRSEEEMSRRSGIRIEWLIPATIFICNLSISFAQSFYADIKTTPFGVDRLFMDSAESELAPVDSQLWVIADISGDGIYGETALNVGQINNMLNLEGDNHVIYQGKVDGSLLGDQAGKFLKLSLSLAAQYRDAQISVLLWGDANGNGIVAEVGDTYGILNIGRGSRPDLGNIQFDIDSSIHADQHVVGQQAPYECEPVSYDIWESRWFDFDTSPDADLDNDGLINLLEYAFGANPLEANPHPVQIAYIEEADQTFMQITAPFCKYHEEVGLTVESSVDLINWSSAHVQQQLVDETEFKLWYQYRVQVSHPVLFMRLNVTRKRGL